MKLFDVVELTSEECGEEWQAYVNNAPRSSLYHALEWRDVLLRTFRHRCWYLMVREDGVIRGVLPLVEMQSVLFGHFFVSLPFLNYGGILADTPDCEATLALAATQLVQRRKARYVELRQSFAGTNLARAGWKLRQHKVSLVIRLSVDPETHWCDLSSRLRGKVRKAAKSGATFSVGRAEMLDDFYRVFARNMRDLGTPVYSGALFRNVFRLFDDAMVLLVRRAGRPVAAAIALRRGKRVELPLVCSDYSQLSSNVNEFLYWNAIQWSCQSRACELDLGRSSINAGTYLFKKQWNPDVRPLFWYHWLGPRTEIPDLSPNNPKYAVAVRWWKRMPLGLANLVGPSIVRNIP
jgi:serine/alanine adding enzyme